MAAVEVPRSQNVCFRAGLSESTHCIFYKQHLVREESAITPRARTLFTLGWPPYANVETVQQTYARFGEIEKVYLKRHPGVIRDLEEVNGKDIKDNFKVAYVVFKNEASLKGLLSKSSKKIDVNVDDSLLGMAKWCRQYMEERTDVSALTCSADDFMNDFDTEEADKEKKEQARLAEEAEAGWEIQGTKGRKRKKLLSSDSKGDQNKKSKKKKKELVHFYAFQQRETKRDQIALLRKKFEEDKLKVQAMRQARKFRPF